MAVSCLALLVAGRGRDHRPGAGDDDAAAQANASATASAQARLSTQTTFARMAWTPGDGLCDSKAGIQPIEMTP